MPVCSSCQQETCRETRINIGTSLCSWGSSRDQTTGCIFRTDICNTPFFHITSAACKSGSWVRFEYYDDEELYTEKWAIATVRSIYNYSERSARFYIQCEKQTWSKQLILENGFQLVKEKVIELAGTSNKFPDFMQLGIFDVSPTEQDISVINFVIKNQIDSAIFTKTPMPLQILRHLVERFSAGVDIAHLRFYWEEGVLDAQALFEGFNVIYRQQISDNFTLYERLMTPCCRRNFVQETEEKF